MRRGNAPLKKLLRLALNPKMDLWSLDECHFQQHGTRCRLWVPPELKDPVLLHAPTRKSVACFGAVNPGTGALLTAHAAWFNAESFESFLKRLLRRRAKGKRMVVVLDNARYHHARSLKPLLRKYRRALMLLYLPPYSPQFNVIERVWNSRAGWPPTIGTSPHSTNSSPRPRPSSPDGATQTRRCADYDAFI